MSRHIRTRVLWVLTATVLLATTGQSQERFSFYHPSTPEIVERMLSMAELRDDDVILDLGSGDGLIPLTAARMNRRLRGRGLDIDARLVEQSNQRARSEGLGDRVTFEHRNAFDADLKDATVVTMWLFPELMRLLRPIILERARPGTRVLTSTWDLGSWQADEVSNDGTAIYMWIVPAKVGGGWQWNFDIGGKRIRYAAFIDQRFQMLDGVARAGDRREVLEAITLRGTAIRFTLAITLDGMGLTQHEFTGAVNGDEMAGTVKITPASQSTQELPWRARRANQSDYFAPTGTAVVPPETIPALSIP
jgi:hypothetical protein